MITLSQKQSDAWHYLEDKTTTEVCYGGGAGGGKSYFGCVWHITRRLLYPKTRGLIGRRNLTTLKESTLITFFKACDDMGYVAGEHYKYNAKDSIVLWSNGSRTIFKDLDHYPSDPDYQRLGSTEFTDVFIDEATEVTLKLFEILKSRIRWMIHKYDLAPKILITCNPSPGWVKTRFVLDDEDKPVKLEPHQKFIQALVRDNPDIDFARSYESNLLSITDDYTRNRLLFGDWNAKAKAERPFATNFDRKIHVSDRATFTNRKIIYISFDFNLDPFCFILQHKWTDNGKFYCHTFDEARIENASLEDGLKWLHEKYGQWRHNFIITGDKMGDRRDFGQKDKASYYGRMKTFFNLRPNQIETPGNPNHENSRDDVNYVLHHFDEYLIHPSCRGSISDMESVEVDIYGKIKKANRDRPEERADHLDCHRYAINDKFMQTWIKWHRKRNIQRMN